MEPEAWRWKMNVKAARNLASSQKMDRQKAVCALRGGYLQHRTWWMPRSKRTETSPRLGQTYPLCYITRDSRVTTGRGGPDLPQVHGLASRSAAISLEHCKYATLFTMLRLYTLRERAVIQKRSHRARDTYDTLDVRGLPPFPSSTRNSSCRPKLE